MTRSKRDRLAWTLVAICAMTAPIWIWAMDRQHDQLLIARARSEAMSEGLSQSLRAVVVVTVEANPDLTVVEWSEGATQLFGWSRDEMVGRSIERIIPEEMLPKHRAAAKRQADKIRNGHSPEVTITRCRANTKWGHTVEVMITRRHSGDHYVATIDRLSDVKEISIL